MVDGSPRPLINALVYLRQTSYRDLPSDSLYIWTMFSISRATLQHYTLLDEAKTQKHYVSPNTSLREGSTSPAITPQAQPTYQLSTKTNTFRNIQPTRETYIPFTSSQLKTRPELYHLSFQVVVQASLKPLQIPNHLEDPAHPCSSDQCTMPPPQQTPTRETSQTDIKPILTPC